MLPIFRGAMPFTASLVFSLIYERADVTIIGQFLGTEQAGLYGPAATLVTTLFLIPASAYAVMVPVFTRAHAIQAAQFATTLRLFLAVNTALGICLAAGLAFSAGWIMQQLYGDQYAESGAVLAILSLVLGLRCVTFALGAAVVGAGLQTRRLKAQALAAALNVVINLIIVGAWGIRGVAWVYVFTEFVLLIGYWLALAPMRLRGAPKTVR
jgi:O-antigen/teichoic acid export membrane protein